MSSSRGSSGGLPVGGGGGRDGGGAEVARAPPESGGGGPLVGGGDGGGVELQEISVDGGSSAVAEATKVARAGGRREWRGSLAKGGEKDVEAKAAGTGRWERFVGGSGARRCRKGGRGWWGSSREMEERGGVVGRRRI
ncbi:serine, glycine and glutamine-rich protein-like [Setaria italica]|uniref:serine, glycine and glutamine-rich protein-like n=1 Tax=Setaria italica TaxID=4555 RepID=UPI000350E728|nr:serine, glycine and glutamine-rich protein-like [Setaria italica]